MTYAYAFTFKQACTDTVTFNIINEIKGNIEKGATD